MSDDQSKSPETALSPQAQCIQLLKKKGTGPTMSKSLNKTDLITVQNLLLSPDVELTTKATLLTAIFTLDATDVETEWRTKVSHHPEYYLTNELISLLPSTNTNNTFVTLIHKVISKINLTEPECQTAIEKLFDPSTPEYLKAAFLEAERLKRETLIENKVFLSHFWKIAQHFQSNLPLVIDISNGYDGFNRTPYLAPFIATLLSAMGFPTILHGVEEVSPKFGINTFKILCAAGKNPYRSPGEIIQRLQNPAIAWGYLDQEQSFPELHHLIGLRKRMVKRPFIATYEKLLQPIQAQKNYLVTGYTHPEYRQTTIELLNHLNTHDRYVIFRGVEGSSQLPTDRRVPCITGGSQTQTNETFIRPSDYGLTETEKPMEFTGNAAETLELGLKGLSGQSPEISELLTYQVSAILDQLNLMPPAMALQKSQDAIKTGKAVSHWING